MSSMKFTLLKGSTGFGGLCAGVALSLANIEIWLRLTSLGLGVIIGALTVVSLVRPWFKK
jgi:hypothetical protein